MWHACYWVIVCSTSLECITTTSISSCVLSWDQINVHTKFITRMQRRGWCGIWPLQKNESFNLFRSPDDPDHGLTFNMFQYEQMRIFRRSRLLFYIYYLLYKCYRAYVSQLLSQKRSTHLLRSHRSFEYPFSRINATPGCILANTQNFRMIQFVKRKQFEVYCLWMFTWHIS